jgi:hypothetical protein
MTGKRKLAAPGAQEAVTPTKRSKRLQILNDSKLAKQVKSETPNVSPTNGKSKNEKSKSNSKSNSKSKKPTLDFLVEKNGKPMVDKESNTAGKVRGSNGESVGEKGANKYTKEKGGNGMSQAKAVHPFFQTPSQRQQLAKEELLEKEKCLQNELAQKEKQYKELGMCCHTNIEQLNT